MAEQQSSREKKASEETYGGALFHGHFLLLPYIKLFLERSLDCMFELKPLSFLALTLPVEQLPCVSGRHHSGQSYSESKRNVSEK